MTVYEFTSETFQGPLAKLLELIEEKKMEITGMSLAAVTEDFLKYIKTFEGKAGTEHIVADFLVVASRLILIKSKSLLPSLELTEEEEGDIQNLELRLKIFQEFKKAHPHLREGWSVSPQLYTREFFMTAETLFYPPKTLGPAQMRNAVAHMVGELERVFRPTASIKREILQLKQKIEDVLTRLTSSPTGFNALRQSGGRDEMVVLFLAILHLIKEQFVDVSQDAHFGDITIAKREATQ